MFIPVIAGFMAVTIWMVRVQNRAIQVGINAEAAAAEQAVIQSQQSVLTASQHLGLLPAAKEFQQLVNSFASGLKVTQGTIHATAALDTGEGVANLIQPAGTVHDEHWLLAHSFESEVFAFPQERSEQRELTFPQSIRGIAPQISDLNRFRDLLRFSGKGHSIQADYEEALRENLEESRKKILDGLQAVRSRIAEQESHLRQLESQP